MVDARDYAKEAVEAARSVMLELVRLLGEYRDDIVIVGGWVPELLMPNADEPHIGSTDVDLALNHARLSSAGYKSILKLLTERGYRSDKDQPFRFFRNVGDLVVEVDLLAGEYGGTGKSHRTQKVQELRPRKARGCDLAFETPTEIKLDATLPGGGKDSAMIRVSSIVPFLVMKGMALHDRLKEKDAYDIYYCIRHYPGGIPLLVKLFEPHLHNKLVIEGIDKIASKFASVDHVGPKHVADFLGISDDDDRELLLRDAFERTNELLTLIRRSFPAR